MDILKIILLLFVVNFSVLSQGVITGRVYDEFSNDPIVYANVRIADSEIGAITDENGVFVIGDLMPGEYRIVVSFLGYRKSVTESLVLRIGTKVLDIGMEKQSQELSEFTVESNPFLGKIETPLSFRRISSAEIEFNPGANRDISKVVQSFPGVASSTAFRNDLIVRGGGPSENVYYLEGVEIPNLNHFATQGASGGPVGIINADLIRGVEFQSGAFPVNRGDVMSSVLDFKMVDGGEQCHTKIALGASELSLGFDGQLGDKTNYILSVRRSYLQFLFSVLDLPFLPTFTDMTTKVESQLSPNDKLTFISIGAYDVNKLNLDVSDDEESAYILSTIPYQTQWSYAMGVVYKHYFEDSYINAVLSHNHLHNDLYKYFENENDNPSQQILDYNSNEGETKLRVEQVMRKRGFKFVSGFGIQYVMYDNKTFKRQFVNDSPSDLNYYTDIDFVKYAMFEQISYVTDNNFLTLSLGGRIDGNTFSQKMKDPLQQFSPRLSASMQIMPEMKLNMSIGKYYQLPAYTTLGYKNEEGELVNKNTQPICSKHWTLGLEWMPLGYAMLSVEGFYKDYKYYPMSLRDSVSLASKRAGYDLYGDEAVISASDGRAYGIEVMGRWTGHKGLNLVFSYTWVRSEFSNLRDGDYLPSSWDNKHIFSLTGTKKLPHNWNVGLKFRLQGGAPYTPYDEEKSSLVAAWDASGVAYLDYSQFNSERLKTFTQLDFRVDKNFYYKNWMLGFYLDIQNALNRKYKNAPKLIQQTDDNGTPVVINPNAPTDQQRYALKYINTTSGTVLPTVGIMVEF